MRITKSIVSFATLCVLLTGLQTSSFAQRGGPPASLKAEVSQRLGAGTDITIVYSRPGVKGRKIWGGLVPLGMYPPDQYSDVPYPWRGGANENTTFEVSTDVLIEGEKLPAGKYGIHFIPSEGEWTIMFSKTNSDWGSFTYDEKNDALRVKVTPVKAPMQEWLMYGFENLAGTSATFYLHWEMLKIPIKIEVAR